MESKAVPIPTDGVTSVRVRGYTDLDREAWSDLVARDAGSTLYHSLDWLRAIEETYACRVHRLLAERGGRVSGLLPLVEVRTFLGQRILVSLPFSNYGGPVGGSEERAVLLREAETLGRRAGAAYVEFRMKGPQDERQSPEVPLRERSEYLSPVVDLEGGADRVWRERLHAKTRNQVLKARKSGLTAHVGPDLLEEFVGVYTRRQHELGSPCHGAPWFRNLAARLGRNLELVVIRLGSRTVGGVLILFHRETALVQYGASLEAVHDLCPNNAAYWGAIETACERGCARLDLGRSRLGTGSFHFKAGWGAAPVPTPYLYLLLRTHRIPDIRPDHPRYRWAVAAWKRIPFPVARWLGPRLRPHVMA